MPTMSNWSLRTAKSRKISCKTLYKRQKRRGIPFRYSAAFFKQNQKQKTALKSIRAVHKMVWMNGLEPSTPCMSSRYSNQLSYTHVLRTIVIIPRTCPFGNSLNPQTSPSFSDIIWHFFTNMVVSHPLHRFLFFPAVFSVISRRKAILFPKHPVKGFVAGKSALKRNL